MFIFVSIYSNRLNNMFIFFKDIFLHNKERKTENLDNCRLNS